MAKHGNRSATGLSGSADVLEALGARIDLAPEAVAACVRDVGFGFMFAPSHHQATRFVVPVRKELAVRTIFNFLGPLTNPAGATRQLIGVSDPAYLDVVAGALARLGRPQGVGSVQRRRTRRDEHRRTHPGRRGRTGDRASSARTVDARASRAAPRRAPDAVAGGTPEANADTTRADPRRRAGPARDLAVLNAGAAIYVAGRADVARGGRARRRGDDRRRRRRRRRSSASSRRRRSWPRPA